MRKSNKRYLAYIVPMEEYRDRALCACSVTFLSGALEKVNRQYVLSTDIFRYTFWGVTLEVVELDKSENIVDVHDVGMEDLKEYELSVCYALSYDCKTHRAVCSDGVVYDFGRNYFLTNCPDTCRRILAEIETADNFVAFLYTDRTGNLIYMNFDKNITEAHKLYKYAVYKGFVTNDEKLLKSMKPVVRSSGKDPNAILSQQEIDQIVEDLIDTYHGLKS